MGWTARFYRQQRKDQKIAEEVAKRIEEANKPTLRPPTPVTGTIRYNTSKAVTEVYFSGKWKEINNANLPDNVMMDIPVQIPLQTK